MNFDEKFEANYRFSNVAAGEIPKRRKSSRRQSTPRTVSIGIQKLPFLTFTIYNLGERGSGFRVQGEVQDFTKIQRQFFKDGNLWNDPEFPTNNMSLFYSEESKLKFDWLRPAILVKAPILFGVDPSRFDVNREDVGDCWLLAALSNLTLYPDLFSQVVPDNQNFTFLYCGAFHFRFWQYGRWIDIVVDDQLPTIKNDLVFVRSTSENEFWPALLEKAYAKLHGSYEALKNGRMTEALEDFTGGVSEEYNIIQESPSNMFEIMYKSSERNSIMTCTIETVDPGDINTLTSEGLIKGHAYTITSVKEIQLPEMEQTIPLIRLRNPWKGASEWAGPWSEKSPEWEFISEDVKQTIGLVSESDQEFWISFIEFALYFTKLEICHLPPVSLSQDQLFEGSKVQWKMSSFEDEWVIGVTAGGSHTFEDTFWHNPQYRITINTNNEKDAEEDEEKVEECTIIVALMQKNLRRPQRLMGEEGLNIGFIIYGLGNLDGLSTPLRQDFFANNEPVAESSGFLNVREIVGRYKLAPGTYCLVPSTSEPNIEGEFLLRIFSENNIQITENDEIMGLTNIDEKKKSTKKMICINCAHLTNPQDHKKCNCSPNQEKNKELIKEGEDQTKAVQKFFSKTVKKDLEIDWQMLKEIFAFALKTERLFADFSNDVYRSMIAMMDINFSGKLSYDEFNTLWMDFLNWKNIFKLYENKSQLSTFHLREALNSAGYKVNNHILNILVHRYGTKYGYISFDDFIMCVVRLKTMIDFFKDKDPENTDYATFTLEEWLRKTVYS